MELTSKNSFFRDLDNIGGKAIHKEIEKLHQTISKADSASSIPGMKQLRRTKLYEYKIEVRIQTKVYWILCDVHSSKIEFLRIKSEAWCKTNL